VRPDGDRWLVGVPIQSSRARRRPPVGFHQGRDVFARSRRSQDQRREKLLAVGPFASRLGTPDKIIKALTYRCWQVETHALLGAVGKQRIGVNSSPRGHVPAPDTEVVYRRDARLKHLYHILDAR
jgi:hypothetical protein